MKSIGDNISYQDHENSTTILITPKRQLWKDIAMGLWLLLFTVIGVYLIFQLFGNFSKEEKLMLVVFLSFWLYFEIRVGKAFFWVIKGKEFIKIKKGEFHLKKGIGVYGKMKRYFFDNISSIRAIQRKETSLSYQFEQSYWVVGGETICFDHQNKIITLGRKLNEQETKQLIKLLKKKIKEFSN